MPIFKISKATLRQVEEEEKKLRVEFAKAVLHDYEELGLSLREIGEKRNMSHETARKFLTEARCYQDESQVV